MKTKKVFSLTMLILSCIFCFFSCSETNKTSQTAAELAAVVCEAVPLENGYYSQSDSYFGYYFSDSDGSSLANDVLTDWSVMKSQSQSSENEFGILIASDGKVNRVRDACNSYIENRRNSYLESKAAYSPYEYEKYREASVEVYGNCVAFFIMDKADKSTAVSALKEAIGD